MSMSINKAVKLLLQKYSAYGLSRKQAERVILQGVERGMTTKQSYDMARYFLSMKNDTEETFSVDDIVGMTGMSREDVLKRLTDGIDTMSDEELDKCFRV